MVGRLGAAMGMRAAKNQELRARALAALKDSDLTEVFETVGTEEDFGEAGAALKTVIAEKMAEYAVRAMKIAKKKKMKLGAAAVIIAAR